MAVLKAMTIDGDDDDDGVRGEQVGKASRAGPEWAGGCHA